MPHLAMLCLVELPHAMPSRAELCHAEPRCASAQLGRGGERYLFGSTPSSSERYIFVFKPPSSERSIFGFKPPMQSVPPQLVSRVAACEQSGTHACSSSQRKLRPV